MRKLLTILVLFYSFGSSAQHASHLIYPGGDGGFFQSGNGSWSAGDTIKVKTDTAWTYLAIQNLVGTPSARFIIMPSDTNRIVTLKNGIDISGSVYTIVDGTHHSVDSNAAITDATYCGFYVTWSLGTDDPQQVAIGITGKAHDLLVKGVRVFHKTFGSWIKQDPLCDTTFNYPNLKMYNIELRQCDFDDIWSDCIYAGNTDPLGTRSYSCGDTVAHFIPARLENISINHNRIRHAHRTGIQLGGAETGYNQIYANEVDKSGYEWNNQQGDAIAIGGMTRNCHVFNNKINGTFLYGVMDFGIEDSYVENNTIDSVGLLDLANYYPYAGLNYDSLATALGYPLKYGHYLFNNFSRPANILTSTKQTIPDGYHKTVHYKNNLMGWNATTQDSLGCIQFAQFSIYDTAWTRLNEVCSNTRLTGGNVTIVQYTYNPGTGNQSWPVYITTGCGVIRSKFFTWKLKFKPRH